MNMGTFTYHFCRISVFLLVAVLASTGTIMSSTRAVANLLLFPCFSKYYHISVLVRFFCVWIFRLLRGFNNDLFLSQNGHKCDYTSIIYHSS
jgi:hypothetical protein